MRVARTFWITFCVTLCAFCKTFAEVNSRNLCNRDFDETSAIKTPGDNGFRIKIAGRPPPEKYTPGQVYTGKCVHLSYSVVCLSFLRTDNDYYESV